MLWKPQPYFVSCCQIQVVQNTLQIILWTFSLLSAMQFRTGNVTASYAWKNILTENIIQFDPASIWNVDLHPKRQTYPCDQVTNGKMEQQWEHSAIHNVFE